jgi:hypothetical protein
MKLYTEEEVKQIQQAILCNHKDAIMDENYCLNITDPIKVPSVTTTLKEEAHEEKFKAEAKELIDAFKKLYNYTSIASPICDSTAKECALICVDKLIKAFEYQRWDFGDDYDTTWSHYKKLKKQIEKL